MDTFGEAKLRSGTGVLDVAGGGAGGGGLAFQLLNYCNVPATVLDPRAPDHKKAIDRLVHAGPHRSSPFHARYDTDVTPKGQPARLPRFVMRTDGYNRLDSWDPLQGADLRARPYHIYERM